MEFREIAHKLNPWYRCECGKLHIVSFNLGQPSTCTCGRKIDPLAR